MANAKGIAAQHHVAAVKPRGKINSKFETASHAACS